MELPSLEQIAGVGFAQAADVYSEGCLHHHPDDGAEVGVADEQVIQLFSPLNHFPKGRAEAGYVPLVCRAGCPEVLLDGGSTGGDVIQCNQGLIP